MNKIMDRILPSFRKMDKENRDIKNPSDNRINGTNGENKRHFTFRQTDKWSTDSHWTDRQAIKDRINGTNGQNNKYFTFRMGLTVLQLELPRMSITTVNPRSRTSSLKIKIIIN